MAPAPTDRRTAPQPGAHRLRRLRDGLGGLAWRLLPRASRDDLRTELGLEYRHHVYPSRGRWEARRWYARQFLGSVLWHLRPLPARRRRRRSGGLMMDSLLSDMRFALRSFGRTRGFSALAVLTIALGVGASTTVFSVLDTVVLQSLPYPESGRIVHLWHDGAVSKAVMMRIMERVSTFEPVAGMVPSRRTLTGDFDPEELSGVEVTAGYWTLFGMRPERGTLPFDAATDPGRERVAVISHRLWQRTFGGDTDIVGRSIRLGDDSVTVIGVVEGSFTPLRRSTDFWTPMVIDTSDFSDYEGVAQVSLYGHLAPGVDLATATADARRAADLERQTAPDAYSEEWVARSRPVPLHDVVVQESRAALWTTMGAVLLVLLIACANVANLLLARSGARQREIAVRIGLGAGRACIVRQMLTESFLLALVGGAVGSLLAALVVAQLGAAWIGVLPRVEALRVNAGMLVFAIVATALASLLFGLAPALRASSVAPRTQLADSIASGTAARHRRLSALLVGLEVAVSVLLVIGAGLMLRTLAELVAVPPGFDPDGVTTLRVHIPVPPTAAEDTARVSYLRAVRQRLEALPGVDSVGTVTFLPMASGVATTVYWVEGRERPEDQPPPNAAFQLVSGDYLETMRIPLRRGRSFTPGDTPGGVNAALINETMARTAFGDQDPIGRHLTMFGSTELEVIGIVGDSRQRAPDRAPEPEVFLSFEQVPFWPTTYVVIRSAGAAPSAASVRAAVWEVDPSVPVLDFAAMSDIVAEASGRTRLFARALSGFGALALLLAAVGVYGVTRHALGQQVREFGIRLALGATPGSIVWTALRRSLPAVVAGAVVGAAAAVALSGVLEGLLYGVSPTDAPTYIAVPLLLTLVGAVAAYLPARRAAALDPRESLNAG